MTLFHTALFRTNLKSYYNKEDIDTLDEYRTKANIGMIKKICKKEPMAENDKTKAYTAVFRSITRVPIFNIFDIWKPYDNGKSDIILDTTSSQQKPIYFAMTPLTYVM